MYWHFFWIFSFACAFWADHSHCERYVLTFANSSLAYDASLFEPMPNSSIVKQYGRRLVLSFSEALLPNALLEFYGGSNIVVSIEKDALVSPMQVTNFSIIAALNNSTDFRETLAPFLQYNSIEWQFAANEPYGMQVERLWQLTNGSLHTRIAVLDSGIAAIARERLWFENLEQGHDFISDIDLSLDGDGRDSNPEDPGDAGPQCPQPSWHGTKMAFAMAGKHNVVEGLSSVAWNTTIQPHRVLGLCSTGYANDLTDAIVWAAGGQINGLGVNPKPADIISISIVGYGQCPDYLQSAIALAVNQHHRIIVTSAGNQGSGNPLYFPANCRGVVSIGASTRDGKLASYSNRNIGITLLAPGGTPEFPIKTLFGHEMWGTSVSAALTSGFFSLVSNIVSPYTNIDLRWILQKSSVLVDINDNENMVHCIDNRECGTGILNCLFLLNFNESSHDWSFVNQSAYLVYQPPGNVSYPIDFSFDKRFLYPKIYGSSAFPLCQPGTYIETIGSALYSSESSGYVTMVRQLQTSSISTYVFDFVSSINIVLSGGGGGGGGSRSQSTEPRARGGGGGGGGQVLDVANQNVYQRGMLWTIGPGGGVADAMPGSSGGTTQINLFYNGQTTILSAIGGGGGGYDSNGQSGASGGGGGCHPTNNYGGGTAVNGNNGCPSTASSSGGGGGAGGTCSGPIAGNGRQSTIFNPFITPSLGIGGGGGSCSSGGTSAGNIGATSSGGSGGVASSTTSTISNAPGGRGGDGIIYLGWKCKVCNDGEYPSPNMHAASCAICASGSYCPARSIAMSPCPLNTESPAGSYAVTQCTAKAGYYGQPGFSASPCINNFYCPAGSTAMSPCPSNTQSPTYASTLGQCQANAGYYALNGSDVYGCPAGTYSTGMGATNISNCTSCGVGTYSSIVAATACQTCPNFGTSPERSTNILNCSYLLIDFQINKANGSLEQQQFLSKMSFNLSLDSWEQFNYNMSIRNSSDCPVNTEFKPGTKDCIASAGYYGLVNSDVFPCRKNYYCPVGSVNMSSCPENSNSPVESYDISQCIANIGYYSMGGLGMIGCFSGSYSTVMGATSSYACQNCSLGAYSSGIAMTSPVACQQCPMGTYSNVAAASACQMCMAGKYSSVMGMIASQACLNCSTGEYSNTDASSTCQRCSIGTYSSVVGATSIVACLNCSVGTYSNIVAASSCQVCPSGTYATGIAMISATACINCSIGTYSSATASSQCQLCPLGTFSTGIAGTSFATCLNCSMGTYSSATAASSCQVCPSGTYATGIAMISATTCTNCSPGTYSNATAATACQTCPSLSTSPERAISILNCSYLLIDFQIDEVNQSLSEFQFLDKVSLNVSIDLWQNSNYNLSARNDSLCPLNTEFMSNSRDCIVSAGYYGSVYSNVFPCQASFYCPIGSVNMSYCPQNSNSPAQSYSISQCIANAGYYGLAESGMVGCFSGSYSTKVGATNSSTCQNCSSGTYSSGLAMTSSVACQQCPMGTYSSGLAMTSSVACHNCSMGTYSSSTAASQCQACDLGTYSNTTRMTSATACLNCSWGTYSSSPSASQCQSCDLGTFSNTTRMTSVFACLNCSMGTYSSSPAASQCQSCDLGTYSSSPAASRCQACDLGTYSNTTRMTSAAACLNCSMGTYSSSPAASQCQYCGLGTYSNLTRMTSVATCQNCSRGTYSSSAAASQCQGCDWGTFSNTTAASQCQDCSAGTYSGVTAATVCQLCPNTSTSPSRSSSIFNCSSLHIDFQIDGLNMSFDDIQFLNQFPNNISIIKLNQTQVVVEHVPCPENRFCVDGQILQCPAGAYCPKNVSIDCPAGTFNNLTGATMLANCSACPQNYYCPQRSVYPSACPQNTISQPSSTTIHNCRCKQGFYCVYGKSVTAVISLNVSAYAFENDINGVRTAFINAVAKAAGVDPSKIKITGIKQRGSGARRFKPTANTILVSVMIRNVNANAQIDLGNITITIQKHRASLRHQPKRTSTFHLVFQQWHEQDEVVVSSSYH